MSQHTPGPWFVEDNLYDSLYVTGTLKDEGVETMVLGYDPENGLSIDNAADIALMFAAPDLLEALETMLAHYEREVDRDNVAASARAAIAKAKGENRASTR